jgi:hypothetical protein
VTGHIRGNGNIIEIQGFFSNLDLPRLMAAMHNLISVRKYQDLFLDFSQCTRASMGAMLAVCARSQLYLADGVEINLEQPTLSSLGRLFMNANWAHLIDPHRYTTSPYRGYINVPAIKFCTGDEQHEAVSKIVDSMMTALVDFERSDLRAIEWSLNEITDNVINHSQSHVGGFVHLSNRTIERAVEFAVCDVGIGIPATLRQGLGKYITDSEALDLAIREGVTRDKTFGQGNGLYGSWRIARLSRGVFEIFSGHAHLLSSPEHGLSIEVTKIPFNGTLVVCRIPYSSTVDLEDALVFGGKKHVPVDMIELKYEADDQGNVDFILGKESGGFGSRHAGEPVRKKLLNLSRLSGIKKITVDLSGIPLVSSSYADEVFGKIFVELGPLEFSQRFGFRNIDPLVRQLIDKAVTQRVRNG